LTGAEALGSISSSITSSDRRKIDRTYLENRVKLDPDEIGQLYQQHSRGLIAYACSFVRGFSAAEDIVHHVFVRLLRSDLTIEGAPVPYVYRAVRNTALNDQRRRAHDVDLDDAWLESPPGMEETAVILQSVLSELPMEQREAVTLRIWGQMTFDEIGSTVGVPTKTAESRYRYGLQKLREAMRPITKG
jgi:RNA polymerase sigma-70 factor (ECF subfamily)